MDIHTETPTLATQVLVEQSVSSLSVVSQSSSVTPTLLSNNTTTEISIDQPSFSTLLLVALIMAILVYVAIYIYRYVGNMAQMRGFDFKKTMREGGWTRLGASPHSDKFNEGFDTLADDDDIQSLEHGQFFKMSDLK